MSAEWIGLIGGLAGTVLGWFLSWLSQRGRVHIYTEWNEEFTQDDRYGGTKLSDSKDNADHYSYQLQLDLYNGSAEPRIMRKIEVVYRKNRKELFRVTPRDDSTVRMSGSARFYDDVLPITIPAKTILTVKLHGGMHKQDNYLPKVWEANRIELSYRNRKDHEKHALIKKEDFAHYFENHPVTESEK